MIQLSNSGAYLINGTELVYDNADAQAIIAQKTGKNVTEAEARKETIAYGILESHNTSGNMDKLKIKFDKRWFLFLLLPRLHSYRFSAQ